MVLRSPAIGILLWLKALFWLLQLPVRLMSSSLREHLWWPNVNVLSITYQENVYVQTKRSFLGTSEYIRTETTVLMSLNVSGLVCIHK